MAGMALNESNNTNSSILCTFNDTVDAKMYPAFYSLCFIFGLPGNCLSLYVASVLMWRGNSLAVYLVNLSISDLLNIICLPVWILLALKYEVGNTLCSLINVIMYNSFYVGSGLLCCISMDRYLAVVFPLRHATAPRVRTAVLVSISVWLIEISLHIGLLAYTGDLQTFSPARLCDVKTAMTVKHAHMAIIRVVLGFLIPLLLMAFCFLQIIMSLHASIFVVASERRKVRNLLLLLLIIYIVAFAPFQVVMLLRGLLEPTNCNFARSLRDYYMVFVATTTINSVADPVIYCFLSESGETEIIRICKICENHVSRLTTMMKSSSSSTA